MRATRQEGASRLEGDILAQLHGAAMPLALKDIFQALELPRNQRSALLGTLEDLCRRKLLSCRQETYSLRKTTELLQGPLSVNPRGFGFVTVENAPAELAISQDVFIPPGWLGGAAHGDRVLIQLVSRRRDRHEGRVIKVLSRATTRLVGTYMAGGVKGLVIPEDSRFPYNLVIRREDSKGAKNGDAVLAEVTSFAAGQRNLDGIVLEVLGDPRNLQVQTEMVIRKFELPHLFPPQVNRQVETLDGTVELAAGRTDLRNVAHVTIDGETARDFDDAVAIETRKDGGFRLYVSIADVSHYVRPGSPVDLDAYQRGTSVYFPTRVVPMLPERLSNDLCSLVPHQDRYTFTAVLDFDQDGERVGKHFMKSIIRSRHRLTYTIVKQILADREEAVRERYADMVTDLERMGQLALLLEKRRLKRGSIGFEIPEPFVVLGEENSVDNIIRSERNQAHKLIEEFMLAANEAVAETLAAGRIDSLYRIHEPPDTLKVAEFTEFARSMGLKVDDGGGSPQWFGRVLTLVAGQPQEYIISNLLLRTMQQARYSPNNVGHFGLAATHYTHFTSPIRRYPDLMVHRALAASLSRGPAKAPAAGSTSVSSEEAGTFLSKRERVAVDAEREMVERLQVHFMADKIGETFNAIVSGVTSFGLFIELIDVFVNGAVPITEMKDDYYQLEERRHRLLGQRSGKIFQLGDLVQVRLTSVEVPRRRINFSIIAKQEREPKAP
ncbi:ribonuclease R [Thiovibrio sp. JS02]